MLKQLLIQTVRPYEIIVVNHVFDKKMNAYRNVINEYKSKVRIKHILNKEASLARSYNLGIKLAEGDVILFLDDDMVLDCNLIQEHIKTYIEDSNVCGVQGKVINLRRKILKPPSWKRMYPWRQALPGMERFVFTLTKTYRGLYLGNTRYKETLLRSGGNMSIRGDILLNFVISEENKSCLGFEIDLSLRILDANPQCIFKYNENAKAYHLEYPRGTSRPWNFKSAYSYGKIIISNAFKFKNYLNPKDTNATILLEELLKTVYSLKKMYKTPVHQVLGERLGAIIGLGCSLIKNMVNLSSRFISTFKAVTITFDDAYLSIYEKALPILETYGLKGIVFTISDLIGGFFEGQRLLNITQLRELIDKGWEIGSHTETHRRLADLTIREKIKEIVESKRKLKEMLNANVQTFSYPYGVLDAISTLIVSRFYIFARTVRAGINYLQSWIGHNRYLLKGTIVREENIKKIMNEIKKVKENGGWLILVFHNIVDNVSEIPSNNRKLCWITYSSFRKIIETIVKLEIPVKTFKEIVSTK